MLKQISPTAALIPLTAGRTESIPVSVVDDAGESVNLSSGYTATFELYEKLGETPLLSLATSVITLSAAHAVTEVNATIAITAAETSSILSTSLRPDGVYLRGELRVTLTSTGAIAYSQKVEFEFRQTP